MTRPMPRGRAKAWSGIAALLGLCVSTQARNVSASGGFFSREQPLEQAGERLLFEVGQDTVTLTVQLSFSGEAADFAWIVPLAEVPDPDSLAVFSQQALNTLDALSTPTFRPSCADVGRGAPCPLCAPASVADGQVGVYLRAEVGAYDVSVIGSRDPAELMAWLRAAGYRITPSMAPYLAAYADAGMQLLALKLMPGAGVQDIRPFRFTVPGTSPSIPLRMTALAAEPELPVLAFVLGSQRYEGKNWPNLELPDEQLRFDPFLSPSQTNWSTLVARAVDEAGGRGWITEYAGPSAGYAEQLRAQLTRGDFPTPEARQSTQELLSVLERYPYLTRLYTRLSAEEMITDPVLGPSALGEVSGEHRLLPEVAGIEQCSGDVFVASDACDFNTCGAGGSCYLTNALGANGAAQAGCACVPGATARTTLGPSGSPTVICQDQRLSFLDAGEAANGETPPEVCASLHCGDHGRCVAMNLTPTCACDRGFVATVGQAKDGTPQPTCVQPRAAVPAAFYQRRLPALPELLPGGREVRLPEPRPMRAPVPLDLPGAGRVPGAAVGGGACALSMPRSGSGSGSPPRWLSLGLLAAGLLCRRRRDTRSTLHAGS